MRDYFKVAKKAALKTKDMRRQFGAVIVKNRRIIAIGHNRKSHPAIPNTVVCGKGYKSLHAEIDALLRCDEDVSGATIYVYGQNNRSGNVVNCQPCKICRVHLIRHGIFKAFGAMEV